MLPVLQRSSPLLDHGNRQPVPVGLTNTQMSLISDTDVDHLAALLERVQTVLKAHECSHELQTHEGLPRMLLVGSRLDRGIVRKHTPNEDSLFILQSVLHSSHTPPRLLALFVVADGMGGHEHGQEASQLAIVSLAEYVSASLWSKELLPDTFPSLLREGIQYANQAVYQRNQEDGSNMGTTITAILVNSLRAHVAHVGDSRAYHYHPSAGLVQLTQDHSLVAALVAAGAIQPDEVYTHPARNQIYRSLGQRPTIEVDSNVVPLTVGDRLLLCSDGLWEMVRDREMANILAHSTRDPADAAKALVQAALTSGGVDNVSAMVVQV